MPPVRRLPVLQESAAPDDGRPAWHWTFIGTLFAVSIWVPLAMMGNWLGGKAASIVIGDVPPDALEDHLRSAGWGARVGLWLAVAGVPFLCFAISCSAAGILVGRFGNRAGAREAALGGGLAGVGGALLVINQAGFGPAFASLLVLLPVGGGAAWWSGRFGYNLRPLNERRS